MPTGPLRVCLLRHLRVARPADGHGVCRHAGGADGQCGASCIIARTGGPACPGRAEDVTSEGSSLRGQYVTTVTMLLMFASPLLKIGARMWPIVEPSLGEAVWERPRRDGR